MQNRPRRNRRSAAIRAMVRETRLHPAQLIQPLFLLPGEQLKTEVSSLPGTYRFTSDLLLQEVAECLAVGINSFILFPAVPEEFKDKEATYSYREDNFYLVAARKLKERFPEICLISDVAMDPYSIDGHDGLVGEGQILNDASLPILAKMGVAQAQAGFDLLGPSDMMDGRVGAIREVLDSE
ncbi:MAG: porphobilinogen synthase, partial [Bacteroidota bacterium]